MDAAQPSVDRRKFTVRLFEFGLRALEIIHEFGDLCASGKVRHRESCPVPAQRSWIQNRCSWPVQTELLSNVAAMGRSRDRTADPGLRDSEWLEFSTPASRRGLRQ